jgi:DNA repair exonuclease SbcCD ATPase subunit
VKTEILAALFLALTPLLAACNRKPAIPDARNSFRQGDIYFEAGEYAKAADAYEAYLSNKPSTKEHDRVLFNLALAYSVPSTSVYNPQKARERLERLLALFPGSRYAAHSRLILKLNGDVAALKADIKRREDQIISLNGEIETLKNEIAQREKRGAFLAGEMERQKRGSDSRIAQLQNEAERLRHETERLRSSLGEKEGQIRALRNELQQLKRIDIERRPLRSPH